MSENKMGYRGSKSDLNTSNKSKSVKEQRVDGSYFGYKPKLRCTLMDGQSRYQISNPSKQLNIQTRNLSIDSQKICKHLICKKHNSLSVLPEQSKVATVKDYSNKLTPGFTDAEGCFGVYIYKNTN